MNIENANAIERACCSPALTVKKPSILVALVAAALAAALALSLGITNAWAANASSDLVAANPSASGLKTQSYNTAYALLNSDGKLYRCDASGNRDYTSWHAGTAGHNDYYWKRPAEFGRVTTLYISSQLTSMPHNFNYNYVTDYGGSGVESDNITGLANLQQVVFLTNSQGKSSVTKIEEKAFYGLEKLKSVTNLNKTQAYDIGNHAFQNCKSLTGITMPTTLETIGRWSFYGCSRLATVNNLGKTRLTEIGACAFEKCRVLKGITLPTSLQLIRDNAFASCESLPSITIPANVTEIENSAFSNCSRLMTVTCKALNYPTASFGLFSDTPIANKAYAKKAFIYVPWSRSVLDSYRNAYGWRTYSDRIVCAKKAQPMTVAGSTKTASWSKARKGNVKVGRVTTVKKAQGRISFLKTSGSAKISIESATGNLTVKKGIAKGTYTISVRVTAQGNDLYKAGNKTVKVTVKVC